MNKDPSSAASGPIRSDSRGGFFSKAGSTLTRSAGKRHKVQAASVSAVPFSFPLHRQGSQVSSNQDDSSLSGSATTNQSTPEEELSIGGTKISVPAPPSTTFAVESGSHSTMIVAPFGNNHKKDTTQSKNAGVSYSNNDYGQGVNGGPSAVSGTVGSSQNPNILYQHIHEMASKRMSTLDYLRKAHEGRVYWFNTVHFSKPDLARLPYFDPRKLSRRATNYLLLGLSIPTILDLNSSSALDFLRALNALLLEFESFQQIHPPDGSSTSSLARARIPHMFKRATHAGNKSRRTSSATEIGLPMQSSDPSDIKNMSGGASIASSSSAAGSYATSTTSTNSTLTSFPTGALESSDLLPGEEYTHLLTPSLPFDPDFYETFATLCDVLIDCYTRILSLISSPSICNPTVGEVFGKADARLRKVIVAGVVREFEDASRNGAKGELAGVGKVVLGGLMGG